MKRMYRVFGDLDALRYVDGRLDGDRRAAFLSHVADHPAEAERVAVWRRQDEMLRAAFAGVVLEPVPAALRLSNLPLSTRGRGSVERPTAAVARLPAVGARPAGEPSSRPVRPTNRRLPLTVALLGLIAGLVLLLSHGLLALPEPAPSLAPGGQAPLVARALDAHTTYALDPLHPVEMPVGEGGRLAAWLRQRLGATPAPPDLRKDGWTLLGGRLVPGPDHRPAALYVFEGSDGARLSLLVARQGRPHPQAAMLEAAPGLDLATMAWAANDQAYVVTVPRSLDWLSRNGQGLRDRIDAASAD